MKLPAPPKALLRFDVASVATPSISTDAEGDPAGASTTSTSVRGTLLRVSASEQLLAQQRGTNVDKAFAVELGMNLNEGDVLTIYGAVYEVITAEDRRLYRRLLLRKR